MSETELEDRLRHSLRTVAHLTAVPPRPRLAVSPVRRWSGLRLLAVAAALVAILGAVAFGQLAGAWHYAGPTGPGPRGEAPFPAVQKLVSLEDPVLAKEEVDSMFSALELDVTMVLVPTGPDRARLLLGYRGGVEVENEDEQCDARVLPGCRIRVTVPPGFDGHAVIEVAVDPAGAGPDTEVYGDAFAPGQPLHCHDELLGARLAVVKRWVQAQGLPVEAEFQGVRLAEGADQSVYVNGAGLSRGVVVLSVQVDPYRPTSAERQAVRADC